jgi:DNA polymerase III subunit epsilon
MKALFYDSETSGLPLFNDPSEDPRQPHIVQLAAKLIDLETRKVHASFDVIIEPKEWAIPEDVAKIHGITHELACQVGIDEPLAIRLLLNLWDCADVRVGHSEPFDARIIRIGLKRYADKLPAYDADEWKAGTAHCTGQMSRSHCKLPKNKMPTLTEALEVLTGRKLEGAHTAGADVDACIAVYFAMKDLEGPPVWP